MQEKMFDLQQSREAIALTKANEYAGKTPTSSDKSASPYKTQTLAEQTRQKRLVSLKKFEEQRNQKRDELSSSRYSIFREEFEDIFEATLNKKQEEVL